MFINKTKIKFHDCDPAGILFYGRVYSLCHAAYEEMIESFKLPYDYWANENFIVPIIKSEASYHKPMKYGDEISVEVEVVQLKDSSFELEYVCKNKAGKNV
jgi:1,4-dihydroxy-2-naphthoyl-CoA hydrolase